MQRRPFFLTFAAITIFALPAFARQAGEQGIDADRQADTPPGAELLNRRLSYFLRGSVQDADNGNPVTNVRVDLNALFGPPIGSPAFTNDNGNFGFDGVPGGQYTIDVSAPGYRAYHEQVEISDGSALMMHIVLRKINSGDAPSNSKPTVSARDLAIPAKAHQSMDKGVALLAKSDYSGSVKEFQNAIKAYPSYYEAYAKMGLAYLAMKDPGKAEPALKKSLDLSNQKSAEACFLLAKMYSDEKKFNEAEPLARKGVALNVTSYESNLELGRALYGEGKTEEAEKSAHAAQTLQPGHPGVYILLTNIHYSLNDLPAVLQDMDSYLKLAPSGPAADQIRDARAKIQKQLGTQPTVAPARDADAPSLRK